MYNVINITSKKIKTKQTNKTRSNGVGQLFYKYRQKRKDVSHVKSMSTTQSHDIWRWKSKSWLWTGATM